MLKSLRAVARFFQNTIGWNRIGVLLSIAIISVAAVVLLHMLRDIDTDEVISALKATQPHHIAAAAFFVACGYFTLTFYDLFALRTIGRNEIPYRIAALTGFTSYSIGHNIGATVFTGGAVRYRIYSMYGLDAIEVAKICFIAGLTFWLGNATVLGLGVAYHPEAAVPIDQLPPWLEPRHRSSRCWPCSCLVRDLGLERAARNRPGRVEGAVAERTIHAGADMHRHSRSRLLRACHVHAAAGRTQHRLRDDRGGVCFGNAARLCQSRARRPRRLRRSHACRAVATRQGIRIGGTAVVSGCFTTSCLSRLL